jgi:epsilon-lactone hydrolase
MSIQAAFFRAMAGGLGRLSGANFANERGRRYVTSGSWLLHPPRDFEVSSFRMGAIPAKWLVPPGADPGRTVLYLHGGGWVYGYGPFYDRFVAMIARETGARTLAIDYRLAPEFPFPAALEDCLAAYRCLLEGGTPAQQIVIMGDSAGGNLTLATMLAACQAGLPLPRLGVCLSPATDFSNHGPSWKENAEKDAILKHSFTSYASQAYLAGRDPCDPLLSPVYGDVHGFPPLLIQAGAEEILRSDAESFAEAATRQGVDVTLQIYPGMWHVWQMFAPFLPEANQAIKEIGRFVRERSG